MNKPVMSSHNSMLQRQILNSQKTIVATHFNDVSGDWGAAYRGAIKEISDFDRVARKDSALRFLESIRKDSTKRLSLLDVGCGTGDVGFSLSEDRWRIHGIDLVEAMVRNTRTGCPHMSACVGDVIHLPFAARSFDVLTCLGVLEYLPNWPQAIESFTTVLRPSGHLIISIPNRQSLFRKLGHIEQTTLQAARLPVRWMTGRSIENRRYHHNQWELEEFVNALDQAGFDVHDIRLNTYGLKGRLGDHSRLNLHIARRMQGWWSRPSVLSRHLAWTIVIWCQRRHTPGQSASDMVGPCPPKKPGAIHACNQD